MCGAIRKKYETVSQVTSQVTALQAVLSLTDICFGFNLENQKKKTQIAEIIHHQENA